MGSEIADRMDFGVLRYSMVWEDVELLYDGLEIGPNDHILSITSAGDNVLNLLLKGPATIAAVDLSEAQSALLDLKIAAINRLSHDEFMQLLGVRDSNHRVAYFEMIRKQLPDYAQAYWDARAELIENGLLFSGRLEKYFSEFHRVLKSTIHTDDKVRILLNGSSQDDQLDFYERVWASEEFNRKFRSYFGQENMARHGRDPAQFTYVTEDAGSHFLDRFRYVCTKLPTRTNYYLRAFLTGAYGQDLPPYLQPGNYDRLRSLLKRVIVATSPLETFAAQSGIRFTKANLSNIFEYMSEESMANMLSLLHDHFERASRIAFWNLLVVRHLPIIMNGKFRSLETQANRLWSRDRSWFYRAFRILETL